MADLRDADGDALPIADAYFSFLNLPDQTLYLVSDIGPPTMANELFGDEILWMYHGKNQPPFDSPLDRGEMAIVRDQLPSFKRRQEVDVVSTFHDMVLHNVFLIF